MMWRRMMAFALVMWANLAGNSGYLLHEDFLWKVLSEHFRKCLRFLVIISLNDVPSEIPAILNQALHNRPVSTMNLYIRQNSAAFGSHGRSVLTREQKKNADESDSQQSVSINSTSRNFTSETVYTAQINKSTPRKIVSNEALHRFSEKKWNRTLKECNMLNLEKQLPSVTVASVMSKIPKNICSSFILISDNESDVISYFSSLHKSNDCWNPRNDYLIVLFRSNKVTAQTFKKNCSLLLQTLWKDFQVMTAIIISIVLQGQPCHFEVVKEVTAYNPFQKSSTGFGRVEVFSTANIHNLSTFSASTTKRYNGYPLRVTMFPRVPTAIYKTNEITLMFAKYNHSEPYIGVDGMMLHVLAKHLGFTPMVRRPTDGKEYGYDLPNGTFVGTLGDILYGRTDISLNGVFIKTYRTDMIEFSHYAYHDSVCVIVPKAEQIPKWMIFWVLNLELKLGILITYIVYSCLYYLQKQCHYLWHRGQDVDATETFLEMFHPFLQSPFATLPTLMSERILACTALIFGFATGSMLQGILVTGMTKPFYHPEIDTLQQLDDSGLPIFTGAPSLADTFGLRNQYRESSPTMLQLSRKLKIISNSGEDRWEIIAKEKNQAIIIRQSDSLDRFKEDSKLHIMQECPRSYLIAYLVPRGSPFLPTIDGTLARLLEAGLPHKWTKDTYFSILIKNKVCIDAAKEVFKPFSLQDTLIAFYILLGGWTLSAVIFVFEIRALFHKVRYVPVYIYNLYSLLSVFQ